MASGNSGSFTISGTKNMSAVCYWSETYDVSSNTHVVSIDKLMLKSSNWYGFTYYLDGSVSVNGTAVATFSSSQGTHNCTVSSQNAEYKVNSSSAPSPWTSGSISGNADGTKSVSIALKFKGYTVDGSGANAFSIDSSQAVTLYTIPRKSSVSMSSGTLGSASTISISRASSSFTHTLSYAFGSASGTITTKTTSTSVSWTPSLSLANQIPNSTSGTVTITCSTYSGTTLIGSTTTTATLSVPTSVKPTLSALNVSRVDGDVPSSWGIYVQTKSQATLSISGAAGSYGSSITAYSISGGGYSSTSSSFTTGTLNTSGTVTFIAKVKDSRGRWSDEKTVSISVVAYSAPSFSSYTAQRCTSAGTVSANGTYCKSTVSFNYSTCSSKNSITTATYYKKSTESSYTNASTTFSSGTAFTFGGSSLATDYSYDIKFTLTDVFTTVSVVITLSTASVLMDFKSGGTGIGIGKVAETDNLLDVAFKAKFRNGVSGCVMSLDGYDAAIESDFNNYKDPGVYVGASDFEMANISNAPCTSAGTLYVKNAFGDGKSSSSTWLYRLQLYIPHNGDNFYLRSMTVGSTAGTWTYGSWTTIGADATVNYATTSGKATKDGNGNTISSTYLPLSGGTVTGSLVLSKTTDAPGTANNACPLKIGSVSGTHLELDGDELMAKSSATATGTLYLNHNGGNVYITGYKAFYTACVGYGSMSQNSTLSGTVPSDTRLFIIMMYDSNNAWYSMAVPANSFTSGQTLHLKATSDYYTFSITFSGTTATLKKVAAGTKTVYFIAVR